MSSLPTPNFFSDSPIWLIIWLASSLAALTVDLVTGMPRLIWASSGTAGAVPSPVTWKAWSFWIVVWVIDTGTGPINLKKSAARTKVQTIEARTVTMGVWKKFLRRSPLVVRFISAIQASISYLVLSIQGCEIG